MGCEVYANGNEIACKAGDGKVIAAFPDVCLSPPSPPAGPVPVPYPDTSFSKDMKEGSKTVMIKGQEVMLKDQSYYNTSPLGDEAATKGLGAGVVTHVITGKTYFIAWSMDVKFEGENVDRHIDMTTSNHASPAGNSPTMANMSAQAQQRIKDDKCPCCGKDPHSDAQKADIAAMKADPNKESTSMSESKYYSTDPADKANYNKKTDDLFKEIRAPDSKCKHLLPASDDRTGGCNMYYPTSKKQKDDIEQEYQDWKRANNDSNVYSHNVPKSAGGCPTPPNAVSRANEDPSCAEKEGKLATIQGKRATSVRKAYGIT